jgi:hypothetical protein
LIPLLWKYSISSSISHFQIIQFLKEQGSELENGQKFKIEIQSPDKTLTIQEKDENITLFSLGFTSKHPLKMFVKLIPLPKPDPPKSEMKKEIRISRVT